jgi:hypothetical protein
MNIIWVVESDWLDRARRMRRFSQKIFEFRVVHQNHEEEENSSEFFDFRQGRENPSGFSNHQHNNLITPPDPLL